MKILNNRWIRIISLVFILLVIFLIQNLIYKDLFNISKFLVMTIGISIIYITAFCYIDKKLNLEKMFLIIALVIGIYNCIVVPPYFSFDEKEHFIRGYNVSRGSLIVKQDKKIKWPNNIEDFFSEFNNVIDVAEGRGYERSNNDFLSLIEKYNVKEKDTIENYYHTTAISYTFVPYSISGLGIFVARLLNLGFIWQFYAGRIFNLILFAIIGYFSLKKLHFLKKPAFIIMLLPALFYQMASYSADVFVITFSIYAIANIIDILYKENVQIKNIILFAISIFLLAFAKLSYLPLFLLIFLIPNAYFKNKKETMFIKIGMTIFSGVIFIIAWKMTTSAGLIQWGREGVDAKLQVQNLLKHPLILLPIIIEIFNNVTSFIQHCTVNLAYSGTLNQGLIAFYIIFITYVSITSNEEKISLKIWQKLIICVTIIGMCAGVLGALYLTFTPVGEKAVAGMQGRYFLPIVLPIILLFTTDKIKKESSNTNNLYIVLISSGVLIYQLNFLVNRFLTIN